MSDPINKFLTDCGDLQHFIGDIEEKLKLLELEVGVLLKHPNCEDDGPSDASLQVLQEAKGIQKSLTKSISESSDMSKTMDVLLKDLLEKIRISSQQTAELESFMTDYGYEIPPPLDPILFDIFRDSKMISPPVVVTSEQTQCDETFTSTTSDNTEEKNQSLNTNADDCNQNDEVVSEDEVLNKTEEENQSPSTETKFKPKLVGQDAKSERYAFQTSILNTPVQNINFSKKTINFQNSYLFQSPSINEPTSQLGSVLSSALTPTVELAKSVNITSSQKPGLALGDKSGLCGILTSSSHYDSTSKSSTSSESSDQFIIPATKVNKGEDTVKPIVPSTLVNTQFDDISNFTSSKLEGSSKKSSVLADITTKRTNASRPSTFNPFEFAMRKSGDMKINSVSSEKLYKPQVEETSEPVGKDVVVPLQDHVSAFLNNLDCTIAETTSTLSAQAAAQLSNTAKNAALHEDFPSHPSQAMYSKKSRDELPATPDNVRAFLRSLGDK